MMMTDIEMEVFRLEFMAEVADRVAEGRRAHGLDASEAEEQAWWFRREAELLEGGEKRTGGRPLILVPIPTGVTM